MNMEQLKEFVCLETRKRELDSELKAIAARIDDLEQVLVPQFLTDGVSSMKVDGRTVYIAQDIQAGPLNGSCRGDRGAEAIVRTRPVHFRELQHPVACARSCAKWPERKPGCVANNRTGCSPRRRVRVALPSPLCDTLKISFVHSLRSRKA